MTASMAFYADGNTIIRLARYGTTRTPILTLDGEGHSLTVSAFDRTSLPGATGEGRVRFAPLPRRVSAPAGVQKPT
ncbi:hypothetical protein JCM4814A_09270 [Streptomyces phaeofaciens JCM 4814]|uniref:Uncharacterized protein n=1 Tax=Streptomyces phaeofaciens TaxID=68254 RepID=A0A918HRR0_9ACTN|nr:hypothetical protein [Streptomyces phaeofaciens]GGU00454.1 hypothetical protein GCM10010226_91680 [Streptomyces phaeofaciens]